MGETQAKVEGWYREYSSALLRYLGRRFGRAGAEDLLQETFVQALRRPQRSGEAVSVRAWVCGLARHVGITAFRRRKVLAELPEGVAARESESDERVGQRRQGIDQRAEERRE